MLFYIATPFRFEKNPYLVGFNEIDKKSRSFEILRGTVHGENVDVARNFLAQDFQDKTEDGWLFFIDDDVLLPTDTLDLFIQELSKFPKCKVFYGEYFLKKRTLESAHTHDAKGNPVTIATGLTFIHRSVFTKLREKEVTAFGVPNKPYRWFVCSTEKPNTGEDTYFSELLRKVKIKARKIPNLIGVHVDFPKRAVFGPSSLVRNGKVRFDRSYIYAIDKQISPIYFDIVEHEIEVTNLFFSKAKKHGKICVLTPKRFKTTPILSRLYLDDMRGQYNIDMTTVSEMPRDKARTVLVQEALDSGADFIVFLDDDMIVPFDFIQQLLSTKEPIVGLNYSLKKPFYESASLLTNGDKQCPIPEDAKGLIQTTRCFALGASLIHREVFEKVNFPWFQEWTEENKKDTHQRFDDGSKICYTDDAFFTKRVVDVGYTPKVLADVHAGHVDIKTFNVYGHSSIVDKETARLREVKSSRWALSEKNLLELVV